MLRLTICCRACGCIRVKLATCRSGTWKRQSRNSYPLALMITLAVSGQLRRCMTPGTVQYCNPSPLGDVWRCIMMTPGTVTMCPPPPLLLYYIHRSAYSDVLVRVSICAGPQFSSYQDNPDHFRSVALACDADSGVLLTGKPTSDAGTLGSQGPSTPADDSGSAAEASTGTVTTLDALLSLSKQVRPHPHPHPSPPPPHVPT